MNPFEKCCFPVRYRGLRATFKKNVATSSTITTKLPPHTDKLRWVKVSKLNNFDLMTKLLIDSLIHMLYIMIK